MFEQEKDPLGKQPHESGAKLDAGKSPVLRGVLQYFPRALEAVANVSLHGSTKYAWKGWHDVPDGINRYGDALARHLLAEVTEGPIDKASGLMHAAQVAWNALARLEKMLEQEEEYKKKAKGFDEHKLMDLDKVAPIIHSCPANSIPQLASPVIRTFPPGGKIEFDPSANSSYGRYTDEFVKSHEPTKYWPANTVGEDLVEGK